MPILPHERSLLILALDADRAALPQEYVPPPYGCAGAIVQDLTGTPQANLKILLVGARGGGKSSELREIERRLRDGHGLIVSTVDLRASGIHPGSLSAFDLLYMAALSVLCGLPDGAETQALFRDLKTAYADKDQESLGTLQENRERLVSFSAASAAAAALFGAGLKSLGVDIDLAAGAASAAASGLGAASGMILGPRRQGVVPETSTEGHTLLDVCGKIARARRATTQQHLCVMIDGLEEMNGESNERFRQIFEQTGLLSRMPWSAVISAPPCTLAETKSVEGRGYFTYPVWGFSPDDPARLIHFLEQRFRAAGVDPLDPSSIEPGALSKIAAEAGTLPRHLVYITNRAVRSMGKETTLTTKHAEEGLDFFGQRLCMGLSAEDYQLLAQLHRTKKLPGNDDATRLFADGRILVCPPEKGTRKPMWTVHPLVLPELDDVVEDSKSGASGGGDGPV